MAEAELSSEVLEHIEELRSVAYKKSHKLKCRQRKKKDEPKREVWLWSDDDIKKLCRLIKDGLSDEEIGRVLGRTWVAVRCKRYELGIKNKNKKYLLSDNWLDFIAQKRAKTNDGNNWQKFYDKVKGKFVKGKRYVVKPHVWQNDFNTRAMYFEGIVWNVHEQPMFMFRSKAGYLESFTLQQMQDCIFEVDRR